MNLSYVNKGDNLYGVENYRFAFNGRPSADVELLCFLDNAGFAYHITIYDETLPNQYKNINISSIDIRKEFNCQTIHQGTFKSKEEAFQDIISIIGKVMKKYSEKSIF